MEHDLINVSAWDRENPNLPQIGGKPWPEFIRQVEAFHGYAAPGALLGGIMVELARGRLREMFSGRPVLFSVLVETRACLADAVQLLTPCTVGNRRLTILDLNRYALTLYVKPEGEGVRVFVDGEKIRIWPHLRDWFFCLVGKKDQDEALLREDIRRGGEEACSFAFVRVPQIYLLKEPKNGIRICPICREPYPVSDGGNCRACRGDIPLPAPLGKELPA